jgi:hypothetical protein
MIRTRILASAAALACGLAFTAAPAHARSADYRFELAGKPQLSGQTGIVQVRLVHIADGEPVADAMIFDCKADMGPGMETMTVPVKALPAKDGIYGFEVTPDMAGTWVLHLAAKVQGEAETVRGTVNVDLVK